jgi:multisubunit Na+/H+ antiporter MnhG subunit
MNQPLLVILAMLLCAFRNCPVFEVKRILAVLVALLITPVDVLTRFALIVSVP